MAMLEGTPTEPEKVFVFIQDKCTGCMECNVVCAFSHFGVADFDKSYITIIPDPNKQFYFIGIHCAHCDDPICKASCPVDAIIKDEKTGLVFIDSLKCIGCQFCIVACPISQPRFDVERRVAVKCDFCKFYNYDPRCVKFCPAGALKLLPREEARKLAQTYRGIK